MGLYQGSVKSPYLFDRVIDVLTEDIRGEAPNMLFADDKVIFEFTKEKLGSKLDIWREGIESRGSVTTRDRVRNGKKKRDSEDRS